MEFFRGRDFLFCDMCGTQLQMNSTEFAECQRCYFRRPAKDIIGKETQYIITAEDIRRELKLEPFVILKDAFSCEKEEIRRARTKQSCPKCKHPELEFWTAQIRSADEGQTVYYECPSCGHTYSENN